MYLQKNIRNLNENYNKFGILIRNFEDFLREYYNEQIKMVEIKGGGPLEVLYEDLQKFNPTFISQLENDPITIINLINIAYNNILQGYKGKKVRNSKVRLCIKESLSYFLITVSKIRAEHNSKLIAWKGIILNKKKRRKILCNAYFKCKTCGYKLKIERKTQKIRTPSNCPNERCYGTKANLSRIKSENEYKFIQEIVLGVIPNEAICGKNMITVKLSDDLIKKVKKNDKILVIGVCQIIDDFNFKVKESDLEFFINAENVKKIEI